MVRRLSLLAAVVWFVSALFLWPVGQPVGRVLLGSESGNRSLSIGGFDREGRMVVTGLVSQQRVWPVGPIALHDAKTGERISTLYSGDERIHELLIDEGLAVTKTESAVRLVSLEDRVVIEHPGQFQGLNDPGKLSPGGSRFLTHDGMKLTVYDVATAKTIWSRDNVYRAAWAEDDALHLWLEGRAGLPSDSSNELFRANVVTGVLARGNRKAFAKANEGRLSRDGRFVWWIGSSYENNEPSGLYDLETNRLLWGMDVVRQNGMDPVRMQHLEFSSDSSELQYFYHVPENRWGTARWRVSDGKCLAPLPADAMVSAGRITMATAPDGSWSASSISKLRTTLAPVPAIVWRLPAWASNAISDYITATTEFVDVCDNVNNRLIASIPQWASCLVADADGSGLYLHGGPLITRYEVPPEMSYAAFWLRAGLPAAALLMIVELIGLLWRTRRYPREESPSGELAEVSHSATAAIPS